MNLSFQQVKTILLASGYPLEKVEAFLQAMRECPEIKREFERITLDLIQRGKRAGAIDILGRIRWETAIEGGRDFKCNNNFAPMLARVFVAKFPQHETFFEFREVNSREAA